MNNPKHPDANKELDEILEALVDAPVRHDFQADKYRVLPGSIDTAKTAILARLREDIEREVIGADEVEYSNLDGDAGYWEKHGRNNKRVAERIALQRYVERLGLK